MPNFAYANQTNFRPFSYQEMLAPVLMATQAHQALEEAYSELDSQANAVGSLANETNDPVAFVRYKAYETSLRDQADSLAKNGLTPGSRKSLLDLRSRYSKDIVPIKNAITRRRELADEQRKALLQNPTLMFQRDLNSLSYESSLDRFLENPDYDYGERYSGALLTQQVSQAASNLAKELSSYGNGKRLDAFTKTFIQRHGFTRAQVLDAINNPNRANSQPVLNAIVEQVIGSSNMPKWADNNTMNRAYNYARQGLWSAIGQTQVSSYEDYRAKLAAQEAMQRRLMKAKSEELTGGYPNNPTPIISANEKKNLDNNIKNYSKYFYKGKDGHIYMNQAGLKEYNRIVQGKIGGKIMTTPEGTVIGVADPNGKGSYTNFRRFIDSIGGTKYIIKGKMQPGNLGNLWTNYIKNKGVLNGNTATRRTEYITDIKGADLKDFKNKVLRAARDEGQLYGADFDSKKGVFIQTEENLSLADLVKDKYIITARANSADDKTASRTIFVTNYETGQTKRYFTPRGIHYRAENSSDDALHNMHIIEDALYSGKINGKPMTDRQRTILENKYNYYSNMYGMIDSQVGLDYGTPTQSNTPYTW